MERISELEDEVDFLQTVRQAQAVTIRSLRKQVVALEAESNKWLREAQRQEREVERLREALKDIATSGYAYIDKAEEIAEEALEESNDD